MKFLILIPIILFIAGCGEPFIAGTVTGAALEEWADGVQDKFVVATNNIATRTDELNAGLEAAKDIVIVNPETLEAWGQIKGREKDPMTWVALAQGLGLATWFGKYLKGRA